MPDTNAAKLPAPQLQVRSPSRLLWEIVALGAVLRLIALGHKSFWLDEIASVVIARLPGISFWHWLWRQEGNMALYYVLLHPWLHVGLGEARVRLLSVIPGVLAIPMMYLLGARLFQKSTGILAALFLAVNTCAIVYSQEARGYSLLLLGVIASTYVFVRLIEAPTPALACTYAVVAGALLYCHYFGIFVILAHAVSLPWLPPGRRWKSLVLAATLFVVLALPVFWMMHTQDPGHINWVQRPSLLEVYHLGVFLAAESGKGAGTVLLALDLVLLAFFFRHMRIVWAEADDRLQRWRYALVASGLLTPMVATLLISIVKPVFFHRFLIICLPAWILATVVGVEQIGGHRKRMGATFAVCLLSLVSTVLSYTRVREDWRGVATYLIAQAGPQDRVLYYQPIGFFATENYRDWLPGGNTLRPPGVMVNPPGMDWQKQIGDAQRIWLVSYPQSLHDAVSSAIDTELQRRFAIVNRQTFRAVTLTEYRARSEAGDLR